VQIAPEKKKKKKKVDFPKMKKDHQTENTESIPLKVNLTLNPRNQNFEFKEKFISL